jgi:hypothetical protein
MDDQFAIALCDKCERPTAHRIAEEKLQCVICYPKPNKELQNTEAKGSAVAGGCEADYHQAYNWADGMMKNDEKLVAAVSGLNDGDWGTIRDRLADAYMAGKM